VNVKYPITQNLFSCLIAQRAVLLAIMSLLARIVSAQQVEGVPSIDKLEKQLQAKKGAAASKASAAAMSAKSAKEAETLKEKEALFERSARNWMGTWLNAPESEWEMGDPGLCYYKHPQNYEISFDTPDQQTNSLRGRFRETMQTEIEWDHPHKVPNLNDRGYRHRDRCLSEENRNTEPAYTMTGSVFMTLVPGKSQQDVEIITEKCTGTKCPEPSRFTWQMTMLANGEVDRSAYNASFRFTKRY
jgi:hypothetical protein